MWEVRLKPILKFLLWPVETQASFHLQELVMEELGLFTWQTGEFCLSLLNASLKSSVLWYRCGQDREKVASWLLSWGKFITGLVTRVPISVTSKRVSGGIPKGFISTLPFQHTCLFRMRYRQQADQIFEWYKT